MGGSKENERIPFLSYRENVRTLTFLIYAIFFILIAITAWGFLGYTNISAVIPVWALLIMGFIYLLYAVSDRHPSRSIERLPYVSLALTVWLLILIMKQFYPIALQDEVVIDTYAAYVFLHHSDPYVSGNMVNAFLHYHLPLSHTTPLRAGGYVYYIVYPALSVYAFMPSVLFGLPDYTMLIVFNIATFFVVVYYYRKSGFEQNIPALAILVFIEAELLGGAITGETDIIWVFFVALAYIFRKKPWAAGLFFGLAVAQKQIPILIAPFMLYLVFRENGRSWKSVTVPVITAGLAFTIANIPFIAMNPHAWVESMLMAAEQPLVGVGFGFSILSFVGYAPLPSAIFTDLLFTSLAFFTIFYIRYYDSVKYGFFTFPIIMFLFDFRSLENYIIYWPLLTMLVLPDYISWSRGKKSNTTGNAAAPSRREPFFNAKSGVLTRTNFSILLIIIVVLGGGASAGYTYHADNVFNQQLTVKNITAFGNPVMVDSKITSMNVSINYRPLTGAGNDIPVYFRIIPPGPVSSNINDLLWSSPSPYIAPGNNTLTIYPDHSSDLLQQGVNFTLEAYYGKNTTFYHSTSPYINNTPLQNPYLLYPPTAGKKPYPGWAANTGKNGSLSYAPGSVGIATAPLYNDSSISTVSMTSSINMSELASGNYSLNYNESGAQTWVNGTGAVREFAGTVFTFNSGQEVLRIGYNSSASHTRIISNGRLNITMVSSSTNISFSYLHDYLSGLGWGFSHGRMGYSAASVGHGQVKAAFSNITVYRSGQPVGVFGSSSGGS